MKTLLTIPLFLLSTCLFSNELSWVDEQVEAIKPPRSGMSKQSLNRINDPFIFLKKNIKDEKGKKKASATRVASTNKNTAQKVRIKKQKQVLTLSAILNNSAMINEKWYKKGDTVNGYKLQEVHSKSVLLTKKKKKLLLSTRSISKNLKFNSK